MRLATDIMRFFSFQNRNSTGTKPIPIYSVQDFISNHSQYKNANEVNLICRRLMQKGLLVYMGTNQLGPLIGDTYYSGYISDEHISYRTYDFYAYGFPYIYEHFKHSVLAITGINSNNKSDIGSSFLLNECGLITNAHCVKDMKSKFIHWGSQSTPITEAFVPVDENLDLALIPVEENLLNQHPGFRIRATNILEDVLTMGYPPIPGFDGILIGEKAHIAGHLKIAKGQVVGKSESYLDAQTYILISARVKGGNSGGPVIGEDGSIVGIVAQQPSIDFNGLPDSLGYGVVIPSDIIIKFIDDYRHKTDAVRKLNYD